jgi:hypothetical protein
MVVVGRSGVGVNLLYYGIVGSCCKVKLHSLVRGSTCCFTHHSARVSLDARVPNLNLSATDGFIESNHCITRGPGAEAHIVIVPQYLMMLHSKGNTSNAIIPGVALPVPSLLNPLFFVVSQSIQ